MFRRQLQEVNDGIGLQGKLQLDGYPTGHLNRICADPSCSIAYPAVRYVESLQRHSRSDVHVGSLEVDSFHIPFVRLLYSEGQLQPPLKENPLFPKSFRVSGVSYLPYDIPFPMGVVWETSELWETTHHPPVTFLERSWTGMTNRQGRYRICKGRGNRNQLYNYQETWENSADYCPGSDVTSGRRPHTQTPSDTAS